MQIRKRWPILFAAGAALVYLGNHYQIAGLEHLRLVARPTVPRVEPSESYGPSYSGTGQFSSPAYSNSVPLLSASRASNPGRFTGNSSGPTKTATGNIFERLPPWEPQLTVGEKLAVMQENLSQKISKMVQPQPTGTTPFPLNAPIPLPAELEMIRPDGRAGSAGMPSGSNGIMSTNTLAGSRTTTRSQLDHLPRIRIASFNLQPLDSSKLSKPKVAEMLTTILSTFDLIAIQGVQSDRDDILPALCDRLKHTGRTYDYLIGPRVGNGRVFQQFAFLFDTMRVETDRYQLYTVDDPENLLTFDPLVAWFRCKEIEQDQAFTFSAVNLWIDPNAAAAEQAYLPNLIHAVVHDGRGEDDVLVMGDFAANACQIPGLAHESIRFAIRDTPSDTAGTAMLSSILFSARGTMEYTGSSGTFDFLRKFNLPLDQALEISSQMPVWAEFYAAEGAEPGRIDPAGSPSVL